MGGRRALTLPEILVAIAIVGVAVMALLSMTIGGLKLMSKGRDQVAALDVATRILDASADLYFADIPVDATFDGRTPTTPLGSFPPTPYPGTIINGMEFKIRVQTYKLDDHLMNIRVGVYYQDHSEGLARNISD